MAKRVKLTAAQRAIILAKTGGHCYLCGGKIDASLPKTATRSYEVDHVEPLSGGGANSMDNFWPTHGDCNGLKSNYPVDVAKKMLREKKSTSRPW